jgi:hypothetical protein
MAKKFEWKTYNDLNFEYQIYVGLLFAFALILLLGGMILLATMSKDIPPTNLNPEGGSKILPVHVVGGLVCFGLTALAIYGGYSLMTDPKNEKKCNAAFWTKSSSYVTFPTNLDEDSPDATDVSECDAQKYAQHESDCNAFILKKKENSVFDVYVMYTDKKFDIKCSTSDTFTLYTVKSGDRKATANVSTGCLIRTPPGQNSPASSTFPDLTKDTASNATNASFTKISQTSYDLTLTGTVNTASDPNRRGDALFLYFTVPYSKDFTIETDIVINRVLSATTDFVIAGLWITDNSSNPIYESSKFSYNGTNGLGSNFFRPDTDAILTPQKSVNPISVTTNNTLRIVKIGDTFRGQYKNSSGVFVNICDQNISRLLLTSLPTTLRVGVYMRGNPTSTNPLKATLSNLKYTEIQNPSASSYVTINDIEFDQTGYTVSNLYFWNTQAITTPASTTSTDASACRARCETTPGCAYFSRNIKNSMCDLYSISSTGVGDHMSGIKNDGTNNYSIQLGNVSIYHDSFNETTFANRKTMTLNQCKQMCDSNCACHAWTYRSAGHGNPNLRNTCILYSNNTTITDNNQKMGFVNRNKTTGAAIQPVGTSLYF